jgi:23S rRNA pseudouridine1911/1915/1917 synthase
VTEPFPVPPEQAGQTLAAVLRTLLPGQSWSQVRAVVTGRRAQIDGQLTTDPARRLKAGEVVSVLAKPVPRPKSATPEGLVVRFADEHVVVVEKPPGVNTVRHPAELKWPEQRKMLSPTLHDLTRAALYPHRTGPRLRIVHRLDKETSGLVVFAHSVLAERELGRQFRAHTVVRRYLAVVPGFLPPQTIRTWLVPDRGDGRRGSGLEAAGKHAVTHVEVVERLAGYTVLGCRLETGRTHQIRIHLAETGHPVCGEKVYTRRPDGTILPDESGSPRLALHAAELGFRHPTTGEPMHWTMPLPADLARWVDRLRQAPKGES